MVSQEGCTADFKDQGQTHCDYSEDALSFVEFLISFFCVHTPCIYLLHGKSAHNNSRDVDQGEGKPVAKPENSC